MTVTPSPAVTSANTDPKPVTGTRRYSTAAALSPGLSQTLGPPRRLSAADVGKKSATLGGRRMSAYSRRATALDFMHSDKAMQDLEEEEEEAEGTATAGGRRRKSSLEGIKSFLRSSANRSLGRRRRRSSGEGLGEKPSTADSQDTIEEFENISRSTSDTRCSTHVFL